MSYSNFVTLSSIKAREEETREARKIIIEKAKSKYEADERRKQKQKESGEGTWMLDTVSKRIHKEQKTLEETKSKSKKKKKKKKKHHKHSDSSSSSENSDNEEAWVESTNVTTSNAPDSSAGKPLQRESWMEAPLDWMPAISRQEIRDTANKEKEKAKQEAEKLQQPGRHSRELNPYWKDGGTGLPSAPTSATTQSSGVTGDGGLSWLLKSLSRLKQQAKDEGRSLEEIATERYGSLDRLMSMIREAEKSQGRGGDGGRRGVDRRDRGDGGSRDERERYGDRDTERGKDRYRERDTDRENRSERETDSSKSRDRRRSKEREVRGDRYNRDREKEEGRNDSGRSLGFRRPLSDDEGGSHGRTNLSGSGSRKIFMKPGDEDKRRDRTSGKSRGELEDRKWGHEGRAGKGGWRKSPPRDDGGKPRWQKKDVGNEKDEKKAEGRVERSRKKSSSGSSSSSSEDEKEPLSPGRKTMPESDEEPPMSAPPKVMSEAELNALAAKVLRAEIMGDEKLVSELKATLEEARRVRESSKGADGGGAQADFVHSKRMMERREKEEDEEDNVVVLSRTNKAGMIRPVLPSASEEWGRPSGGKKKKRKNVATHDESGERTKFFHDDDNYDLKTLVEREKAGTAEDQNSMFARLAGRETDRDMDVDDMIVSKAAKNRQEEESVNRDKMAAITEHRKKSSAMEKCTKCFDKIPKHLIIAIGRKSYLCLPDHASLTEGHCLIVPMTHSSSATTLDEDVWQDMQHFRKSLVQMFLSEDKDVVVMETVMRLKHFPHTALECIPLEREVGDLAPIYFKKAMQEVGPEWSHNKKVHDLSKKDIRHTVPKGFPYFSVDFGLQGGFAHVIEDEDTFPSYFGREIVGGMLDVEPGLWRKPRKQNFEDQRQKVLQFEQWWSPFDWTQDIG